MTKDKEDKTGAGASMKRSVPIDMMIVPDTMLDARFQCNPLVTGAPGLRFYAGVLLRTPERWGFPREFRRKFRG